MIEIENDKEGKTIIRLDNTDFIEKIFNRYGYSFKKMRKIKYKGEINIDNILNNNTALMILDKIMQGGDKLKKWLENCSIKGFDDDTENNVEDN